MNNDEHPIVMELESLRAAVARFQNEAHSASVKLQRYSLDTSNIHDRTLRLEQDNALLTAEINVLRRNTTADPYQTSENTHIQELTLSLRRLSEKMDLMEQSYMAQTAQLVQANTELDKAKLKLDQAYALAARLRGREEEGLLRGKMLENQAWHAQEQAKLSDLALREYADLVRSLEGRPSGLAAPTNALEEGKTALERLFADFTEQTSQLHSEVARLRHELEISRAEREAGSQNAENVHNEMAKLLTELQKIQFEDKSAAKMVSRYMTFSQASTNTLQESLVTLKIRHAATVDTLSSQISTLSSQLDHSRSSAEKMRSALDELGGDLMREAFGRRRETALRIRMVSREEGLEKWLQRWIRRAEEDADLSRMIDEAKALEASSLRGSDERITVAENALQTLVDDLRMQTARRLELERLVLLPTQMTRHQDIHSSAREGLERVPSSSSSSTLAPSDTASEEVTLESKDKASLPSLFPPTVPLDELTTEITIPVQAAPHDNIIAVSDISLSPTSSVVLSAPVPLPEETQPSPPTEPAREGASSQLLSELEDVSHRYDTIQRAFRDCHIALQDLRRDLQSNNHPILQTAVERLNDVTEDARVELEIRIADESLQVHGFQTMFSVNVGNTTLTQEQLDKQVHAFVNGEDPVIKRAFKSLKGKLEDIEHDIGAIQRALHDPALLSPPAPTSRPASPSPTFGNVITTRKLRHAQSSTFVKNPYGSLGLRVSMPQVREQPSTIAQMQTPRTRTISVSAMYGLGLRSRGGGPARRVVTTPSKPELDDDDGDDDIE